jgi:hypothetical protein
MPQRAPQALFTNVKEYIYELAAYARNIGRSAPVCAAEFNHSANGAVFMNQDYEKSNISNSRHSFLTAAGRPAMAGAVGPMIGLLTLFSIAFAWQRQARLSRSSARIQAHASRLRVFRAWPGNRPASSLLACTSFKRERRRVE